MSFSDNSKHLSLALGGAAVAALGIALYYKFRNETINSINIQNMSRKQLGTLLDEIIDNQTKMREMLKVLQGDIVKHDLSFNEVCEQVEEKIIPSPLEKYGLSVSMFSQVLAEHNGDAGIREKIVQLTSSSADPSATSLEAIAKKKQHVEQLAEKFSVETVIEVHGYMLERLKETLKNLQVDKKMQPRIATVAAQAYVGKLIQFQYGFSSEDLEAITEYYRPELADDERFFEMGVELKQTLNQLTELCTEGAGPAAVAGGGGKSEL